MNTTPFICSTLIAAATLVALPSCKDGGDTPQQATAVSVRSGVSPEERAAVFSALALLPQDVSDFAVATNIGNSLQRLINSGRFPELNPGDFGDEALALDSAAIAMTAASPASCELVRKVLTTLPIISAYQQITDAEDEMKEKARTLIANHLLENAQKSLGISRGESGLVLDEVWKQAHIPTLYAVITCKPGQDAALHEAYTNALKTLRENKKPWQSDVDDVNGFSGVCLDMAKWRESLQPGNELETLFADLLAERKFYLVARQQPNAVIFALCEDPNELKLAASPADSVLATDKLAYCDANLKKGMLGAALVSKEMQEIHQASGIAGLLKLAPLISESFTQLGLQHAPKRPLYDNTAAALNLLTKEAQQFAHPISHPTTVQAWCDDDLHIHATGDAQGASYEKGTLRLGSIAEAPGTALYLESTPIDSGVTLSSPKVLLEAAMDVARGFAFTLKLQAKRDAEQGIAAVEQFMPELQSLAGACSTIRSGMDGQFAIILDSTQAPLPPIMSGSGQLASVELPRLAYYGGVADRSKLSQGWDALLATAGQVAGKLGADPSSISMLPIVPETVGTATSYKVSMPFFSADFVPSLTVSDKALALGTSSKLNTQLVEGATGTTPFAGSVLNFRFAPLAKSLRSLANALEPGRQHGDLTNSAKALEQTASVVEGIYGASTVKEGVHTITLDVKFTR